MIGINKNTFLFIVLLIVVSSCKSNRFSFLNNYPVQNVPFIDSTSFSNHVEGVLLNKEEQNVLGLSNVFGEDLKADNTKIGISYLPKISDNFKSIVYYFYSGNTQLTSVLVNYDSDFKVVNSQLVASDEIADGLLKTNATIYKDRIVLKEYISESASILTYSILENGDITRE